MSDYSLHGDVSKFTLTGHCRGVCTMIAVPMWIIPFEEQYFRPSPHDNPTAFLCNGIKQIIANAFGETLPSP